MDQTQIHYVTAHNAAELRTSIEIGDARCPSLCSALACLSVSCKNEADWAFGRGELRYALSFILTSPRLVVILVIHHETIFLIVDEEPSWLDVDE